MTSTAIRRTSTARQVQLASQALQTFLKKNRELLQGGAPSFLIISSSSSSSSSSSALPSVDVHSANRVIKQNVEYTKNVEKLYHQNLNKQIEKCHFTIRLQHNIRTVPFHQTAAYPTVSEIRQAFDLYSRSGCSHIFAVGSGAAIDLAKGLYRYCATRSMTSNHSNALILIPSTLGAVLASTAQETLVFSPQEDALLPLQTALPLQDEHDSNKHHHGEKEVELLLAQTVLIDSDVKNSSIVIPTHTFQQCSSATNATTIRTLHCHDSASIYEAAFAALVITLDAALRCYENDDDHTNKMNVQTTFQYIMKGLQTLSLAQYPSSPIPSSTILLLEAQRDIVQALINAGSLLNFHPNSTIRSLSYTLSSALLPPFFPHGNWLSFISSLLPGILSLHPTSSSYYDHNNNTSQLYNFTYFHNLVQEIDRQNIPIHELWTRYSRTMASLAEGTPTYEVLLDKIDAQQALLLGGQDSDFNLYRHILIQSLNK